MRRYRQSQNYPTLIAAMVGALLLSGCSQTSSSVSTSDVSFRPKSYAERKFSATIRQRLDFSCGAAAIATILHFYFGERTSEAKVLSILQQLPDVVDWKKKAQDGFSFADLIFAADKMGYAAQAAEIPVSELAKLSGPVIVHLDKTTFQHFVVLRRITDDVAYVSDPIIGDSVLNIAEFTKLYTNNAMAIWRPGDELPLNSRLQAIRDGLSVSNSVGTRLYRPTVRIHPLI